MIEDLSPSVKYIGVVNFCKPIGRPKSGAREEDMNCFHANLPNESKPNLYENQVICQNISWLILRYFNRIWLFCILILQRLWKCGTREHWVWTLDKLNCKTHPSSIRCIGWEALSSLVRSFVLLSSSSSSSFLSYDDYCNIIWWSSCHPHHHKTEKTQNMQNFEKRRDSNMIFCSVILTI